MGLGENKMRNEADDWFSQFIFLSLYAGVFIFSLWDGRARGRGGGGVGHGYRGEVSQIHQHLCKANRLGMQNAF
jgi:hypothetical protein